MAVPHTHVLIIGGGIAGPALALALHRYGISCAIYEAYPFSDNIGGGFNIAPNGVNVLKQLGVADELIGKCAHADIAIFRDEAGSLLGSFPFGDEAKFGAPALSMSRALLYRTLGTALKERGIPIYYEKRLAIFEETDGGVEAKFEDGTSAKGSIIIGADGVRSVVRKQLLPNGPEPGFTGVIGVGGFVPRDAVPAIPDEQWNGMTFSFGPQGFFGWGGAETGQVMWWSNYLRDEPFTREELTNLNWDVIKADLQANFSTWPSPIPESFANTTNLLRHNIFDIESLPYWSRGRALLIGDAAHAVTPNSGQGASLALEDALMLAKLLNKHPGDFATAFSSFEELRKDRCEAIIAAGRRQGSNKAQVHWLVSKVRNFFIKMMFKFSTASKIAEVMAYKIDLDD